MKPAAAALAILGLSGCNHVFYYPNDVDYGTPADRGFRYSERSWDTADGEHLRAWVVAPEGPRKGAVLHFHGNAQNRSAHFDFVAWLARHGYEVVTFDYRGYDGSSGTPSREGLYQDALRALEAVCVSLEGPRFLLAQSLGGAVLVPALADSPDQGCYQGVVIDSSFASYQGMAEAKLADLGFAPGLRRLFRGLVGPAHDPEDAAPRVELPALVLHGDADGVVPFAQGEALFAALGSADKQFVPLPGGQHIDAFAEDPSPMQAVVLDFFDRHAGR